MAVSDPLGLSRWNASNEQSPLGTEVRQKEAPSQRPFRRSESEILSIDGGQLIFDQKVGGSDDRDFSGLAVRGDVIALCGGHHALLGRGNARVSARGQQAGHGPRGVYP